MSRRQQPAELLSLERRLQRLSAAARAAVLSLAWLFALPGALLCATSALIIFAVFQMFDNFVLMNSTGGIWLLYLIVLFFFIGGGLGCLLVSQQLLLQRFARSYGQTWQQLEQTELPVLVADEVYSLSLLELVKDQLSFQFSGSPLPRSIEDQLLIAASYVSALRICQFSSTDARTPMLREGGRGYLMTRMPARVLRAVGTVGMCIPYVSCLGLVWLPFAFLHASRLCDLHAAQAAFADFFGDAPRRALQPGWWPAKTLLSPRN